MDSKKGKKANVTQNDVAKAAGVTRSMVSYVINGNTDRSVAPETRQRILKVIDELGYRPNKAAQALQLGDEAFASKNIGIVLSNESDFLRPFYTEIIAGIYSSAHENNYNVKFIRFFNELKDPVLFNDLIHPDSIGSLILLANNRAIKDDEDEEIIKKIKAKIQKTLCLEWKHEGLTSILFDRQETAKTATEFLIKKGYKDIAYIGQDDERVFGVQHALLRKNLNAVLSDFYIAKASDTPSAYEEIQKIAKKRPLPRALICGSDEVAIGILHYLNENSIPVPEKVALMSIDNIEMSAFTNPSLTTMNVQKKLMGQRAVEMIIQDQVGQDDSAICITLASEIVERKSC